jgi:PPK2 family polyphosphate:nucleotide phosphotransferase
MAKQSLGDIDPSGHPQCKDKDEAQKKTKELQKELYDLLYLMFAHGKFSLLIILQGIDTSGKDGSVRHIFSGANPQGIKVFSFKAPTTQEYRHDFLWRCHLHTPESGLTAIFNRSYYEEVTTTRVHPELLAKQHLPEEIVASVDFFDQRYEQINNFEKLLVQKGTVVVKFFLHISKEEQKERLEDRLKDLSKNWKFSPQDVKEREHWDEYMDAYDKMLAATSSLHAPWTVVPADHKWYRNFVISKTLVTELRKLKMSFPKVSSQIKEKQL